MWSLSLNSLSQAGKKKRSSAKEWEVQSVEEKRECVIVGPSVFVAGCLDLRDLCDL